MATPLGDQDTADPQPQVQPPPDDPATPGDPPSLSVGWIYHLRKPGLETELRKFQLSTEGTVDEMRKRLVEFLRNGVGSSPTPGPVPVLPLQRDLRPSDTVKTKEWNISFDGKQDPVDFLERLEEITASKNIPVERLLTVLPELLQGEASLWFRNNRCRWTSWDEFVKSFKTIYFPVNYQENLEVDISRRLQKATEPTSTYLTDLQTLMRRHGAVSPAQSLNWIYRNLLPEYRVQIRRNDFHDEETLIQAIRRYETLRGELQPESVRQARPSTSSAAYMHPPSPKPSVPTNKPPTDAVCWRCGETGHFRTGCKNPRKIFCSRCRKEGVFSRDRLCSKTGNATGASVSRGQ